MKTIQRALARMALAAGVLAVAFAAQAQDYPVKPITIVVPFPPGASTDTTARALLPKMTEMLGQPVVVDNRPGSGGNVGTGFVARAKPDGYTLLMGALTSHSVMATLEKGKLQYDLRKDLTPVGIAGSVPLVAVVNPSLPIKSLNELVDYAKKNPGKLNFASSGAGAPQRMAMELFKQIAGVNIVHVAYRGSGPAMTDLVGGQVETMTETVPAAIGFIKGGQLRPLAVLTPERISMLPDVPTAQEQGLTGFNVSSLFGVMAPTGTPPAIVEKLNAALVKALSKEEVKAQLLEQGVYASPMPIAQSQKRLAAEIDQWAKVIHDGKITVN